MPSRLRMSYFFLHQLILKICRAYQSAVRVNNNMGNKAARASRQCGLCSLLQLSSNFHFSATSYWMKGMVFGFHFLQLREIQKLTNKVSVVLLVFGWESNVSATWLFVCGTAQRPAMSGNRLKGLWNFCFVLLLYMTWALKLSWKYCKYVFILGVVV